MFSYCYFIIIRYVLYQYALGQNVSEPWFTQIAARKKIVEGRLYKPDFVNLKPGDTVTWVNEDFGFKRSIKTQVMEITDMTFRRYLIAEKLPNATESRSDDRGQGSQDLQVSLTRRQKRKWCSSDQDQK
jgi:plastocyanin